MPFLSPRSRFRMRRILSRLRADLKDEQWSRGDSFVRALLLRLVNRALRSM